MADLQSYPQITVNETTTNNANVTTAVTGTGPSLNALLDAAGPAPTAMNITFYSPDYMKTIALSVVRGSPNATVVIFTNGSLRDVIPGQDAGAWVSNLTAISIS
jgi:DMSO/TMAO reductase YedYZ molybdopterin-dependent catalytic subunit